MANTFRKINCPRCLGTGKIAIVNGKNLKELREKTGTSLRSLAKQVRVSAQYICDVEHERRTIKNELLGKILDYLNDLPILY